MSGKYATLAPDARGHSSWFLTRTNKEHEATMEHPFMRTIYAENFDKEAYSQYLAGQYHIFHALEGHCAKCVGPPLSTVADEVLGRTEALKKDLAFWWGPGWEAKAATKSPAVLRYLAQLEEDAKDPWRLLCHHFLQYNAVLSGGQFLGSKVVKRANSTAPEGAQFYAFNLASGQSTHSRVQSYLDSMDQLTIPDDLRDRMLVCMRTVYALILALFDEAYDLAKVEGVSFASTKAGSSAGGAVPQQKAKKVPPPPMAPADKAFSAAELLQYDGKTKGKPILTSILGRVYDVTSAKESFGPNGPYHMFAGHDGTYNLAVMSLKKHTVDKTDYTLQAEDKECLSDWIAYFDKNYGRPLGELRDRRHPLSLKDLPQATRIPFEAEEESEEESKPPASRL
mmetsp:Transcript_30663/g.70814  ORF Transcript_30663/g.70814 Transcript_30663/m.70814 type:complete len:396 (-) Transcript_30663:111-1298(-)